ncbi:MAG TPA: hemolysin family protein [Bacteroidia bacterium]|jgi:putative hemolysin|nr:hemolysin family protein [Bacteroidia bacterium]
MVYQLLIIALLLLINGFFCMSEIAIVSSRKSRLEEDAKQGDSRARMALSLANSPNRFLGTVQTGITLISILTGVYGERSMSEILSNKLATIPQLAHYAHPLAFGLVIVFITLVTLLFGELIPKRIGLLNPEAIAKATAGPMTIISLVMRPFVWLLGHSTDLFIRAFRISRSDDSKVTEEEIKALVAEGATSGSIEEVEQDIVENVFQLGDRKIGSLMTNRMDVVWLDVRDDADSNRKKIIDSVHSSFPLCDGELDKIIGIVFIKDLLKTNFLLSPSNLRAITRAPLYLPENMRAWKVLERFKESGTHFAVVIDEFGSIEGLVTMNDLLEAIVGDLASASDTPSEIVKREDGTALVDGLLPFQEFLQYFEVPPIDPNEYSGFHTLGGLILHIAKRIPKTGDIFLWMNYSFEILDMDGRRIDKILVKKMETAG